MPNINKNHFSGVPKLHISRSRFKPSHVETKTSWNNGDLIPLRTFEMYPGDTIDIKLNSFIRELTLLNPVMDDLIMNVWAFFVPNRLVFDSWKEVLGVNNTGAWLPQTEVTVPYASIATAVDHKPGTLWDYFQAIGGASESATNVQLLKLRSYYKIWNDHFRFQPLQVPVLEDTSSSNKSVTGTITVGGTSYSIANYANGQAMRDAIEAAKPTWVPQADNTGLYPLHVCRMADYWSTCLPEPVAESVKIPGIYGDLSDDNISLRSASSAPYLTPFVSETDSTFSGYALDEGGFPYIRDGAAGLTVQGGILVGDSSQATIAGLRQAIALTHFLENDALYGFKNEKSIILGHYGVDNGDARVQLSEYLGGYSFILHQSQVAQTSATGATGTAQGNLAAYTQQFNSSHLCHYDATEHGYLFVLGATRTNRSYSQGIDPSMLRLNKFDFYWPEFANISDSPVYTSTIFNPGGDTKANVFGYQEPFADLRWLGGSQVSAYMRPSFTNSFESYSYADEYSSAPSLTDRWICETAANVDRTLAVTSRVTHQFLGDFYFDVDVYRPMPVYGKPGLLRI